MKANLMFADRDFSSTASLGPGSDALTTDLEMKRILSAISEKDDVVYRACSSALFNPLQSEEEIAYRHQILKDCLGDREGFRELYQLVSAADDRLTRDFQRASLNPYLHEMFLNFQDVLTSQFELLRSLRDLMRKRKGSYRSEGFRNLSAMLEELLPDSFFQEAADRMKNLREKDGYLISAKLGPSLSGVDYRLCSFNAGFEKLRWKLAASIAIQDENAAAKSDLEQRRDRAINACVNDLGQAAEAISRFITLLRGELAFYMGCIRFTELMEQLGMPTCIPTIGPMDSGIRAWKDLYDASLVLLTQKKVSANELPAGKATLTLVTGANQGGKSTFLRSFGQTQLMGQCGMPVPASSVTLPIRRLTLSHFRREEDKRMNRGKLDEELERLDRLLRHLKPGSLLLMNESFASTNELEGSELCRQVTQALLDSGVEVVSVSHLFAFASGWIGKPDVRLLHAERLSSGERTFRIVPGEPTSTAHGEDLYKKVFKA